MKLLFKLLILLVGVVGLPSVAILTFYRWGSASSFPTQRYAEIVSYRQGSQDEPSRREVFTVVTYNIGYLSGLTNNQPLVRSRPLFETNQQTALQALQKLDPDIIGLQEIDLGAKRSFQIDQAQVIARGLELGQGAIAINWDKNYVPFPYWPPTAQFGKVLSGQAILSRYPIQKTTRIVLEKVESKPAYYNAFYLDRLAQVAQVALNGRPIIVINVHLEAFDAPTRLNQTQVVRDLAEGYARDYPVLLMGDFNSAVNRADERDRASVRLIAQSADFTPVVPIDQWGTDSATFPSDQPRYKLDYIFYTPKTLEKMDAQVVSAAQQASDHLPLMMQFRFRNQTQN